MASQEKLNSASAFAIGELSLASTLIIDGGLLDEALQAKLTQHDRDDPRRCRVRTPQADDGFQQPRPSPGLAENQLPPEVRRRSRSRRLGGVPLMAIASVAGSL